MSTTPPPLTPPPQPQGRGWWSRNWKWFVPVGCLTLVGMMVAFILAIFIFVFGLLKSTEVYKDSLARAKNHPAVVEALGSPVEEGFFIQGKTNVDTTSGSADIAIPLSGPKGNAKLYVVAKKTAGQWDYDQLVVEIERTKERIDLLGDESRL